MKPLLTILLIILPLLGNGQIYKVTGSDLTPQITQYKKTIDSLKTALISANNGYNDCWANNYGLKASIKTKSDSILLLKSQLKSANDTLSKYKTLSKTYSYSLDTLKKRLDNILNPKEQMDSLLKASFKNVPTDAFSMRDSAYNTDILVLQHFYDVVPYFKFQTIQRYPINTAQGIRTKELIFTEVEK